MCWTSHRDLGREFRRTTRVPAPPDDLRIADADREKAINELSRHTGDGRLTLEEFEARVDEVLNAKTRADLRGPFRGLPTFALQPERTRRRIDMEAIMRPLMMLAMVALAVVALGVWVLWVAIWFVFPRLWHGSHHGPRAHRDRGELEPARGDDLTLV